MLNSEYLKPDFFSDSDHPAVQNFIQSALDLDGDITAKAAHLFYKVRDEIKYNPYHVILKPDALKASALAVRDNGYCVEKSNLYVAACRALGLPARLSFANVRNHLGTSRLETYLKTDTLVFHGSAEIWLNERWVKLTPVFDKNLCAKLGVEPLDFDPENGCVFQQSDKKGQPFMEYLQDYGSFAVLPFELMIVEWKRFYPHLFEKPVQQAGVIFEF